MFLLHEKKYLFQNSWLLLEGGCYLEGCYWEGALYKVFLFFFQKYREKIEKKYKLKEIGKKTEDQANKKKATEKKNQKQEGPFKNVIHDIPIKQEILEQSNVEKLKKESWMVNKDDWCQ